MSLIACTVHLCGIYCNYRAVATGVLSLYMQCQSVTAKRFACGLHLCRYTPSLGSDRIVNSGPSNYEPGQLLLPPSGVWYGMEEGCSWLGNMGLCGRSSLKG